MAGGGEYEPKDSRNVTGTASTPDGRWTNRDGQPPLAGGRAPAVTEETEFEDEIELELDDDEEEDDPPIRFIVDPKLRREIDESRGE